MHPDEIELTNISKLFEYEKLSRIIDNVEDKETLRIIAKSNIKLYLKQQEVILSWPNQAPDKN
jgi:hypothetical protein